MTGPAGVVERRVHAFLDNADDPTISNPIHSTAVAQRFGFRAALIGGVTVWGWAVPAILVALGDAWLDRGWTEFRFRQPTYPGDDLTIRLTPEAAVRPEPVEGANGHPTHSLTMTNQEGIDCVVGTVGLGDADWLPTLVRPQRMDPAPSPDPRPPLTLDPALPGHDWFAHDADTSLDPMVAYVAESQRVDDPRFIGPEARIHPAWLAGRAERAMRHNWRVEQSIHTQSQIQFLAPAPVGGSVVTGAHCTDVYERKGRHLVQFDCLLQSDTGVDLAQIRHTTIFHLPPA